jgi:UDP-2,3-diacylglucosamine pyrophosphatase LpxH
MSNKIFDCLKNMPERKRNTALATIIAGILLPVILVIALLSIHGAPEFLFDYSPVRSLFTLLASIGFIVLAVAVIDLLVQSHRRNCPARFPFIATWIIASISIIIVIGFSAYISVPRFIQSGDTPPQLILTESNYSSGIPGIAIVFRTPNPTVNTLQWGVSGNTSQVILEEKPARHHWIQLTPLEPDRQYFYSVNNDKAAEFRTPPSSGKPLRFAAAGDSHFGNRASNNKYTGSMLDKIRDPAHQYSMLFILGDLVDLGFTDKLWKQAFSAMSVCTSSIPAYYVIGNHDTLFGGLNLYQDYLCQPSANDNKGLCQWKRIDCGKVHFLVLDLEWELKLYTPEQQKWLHEQLESIPARDWCIVMSHTFYYCSGSIMYGWQWYDNPKTIEALTPLFEQYDVDLVLSGHKHHSEILQKNGVTYVVMGSFGGSPNPERDYISPASIWYRHGGYAFTDITIDNNAATLVVRDTEHRELFKIIVQP